MLKKVGHSRLDYGDIKCDPDGWIDAKKYVPAPFDLVVLKTEDRTVNGWYKGDIWFSRKLEKNPEVLFWKQVPQKFIGGPKDVW